MLTPRQRIMEWLLLCLAMVAGWGWMAEGKSLGEGPCKYTKVMGMAAANCVEKNLNSIPKQLASASIEVLDASFNRLRALQNTTFVGMSYLKYLYLFENRIHTIELAAFEPLTDLLVLDLRVNSIRTLPPILPDSLQRLHLSDNPLANNPLDLTQATHLIVLNISSCDMTQLPDLGELPFLQSLNISDNPLDTLKVHQLASFCNLQYLYLPTSLNSKNYRASCDCDRVSQWVDQHSIITIPYLNCSLSEDQECETNSTQEAEAFEACQITYQKEAYINWTFIAIAAAIVLLSVIVLTILWRRRWRKRSSSKDPEQQSGKNRKLLRDSQTKPRF